MKSKKEEYELLEPPNYTISQQPTARIILSILFMIQLTILSLWLFTLIKRSRDNEIILSFDKIPPVNSKLENQGFFEDYQNNPPVWESRDSNSKCTFTSDNEKFDCHPEKGGSETSCINRGCCWEPKNNSTQRADNCGVPWCFYPRNYGGYRIVNETHTKSGLTAFLSRTFPSPYPDDVKLVRMDIHHQTKYRIHLKILDAESVRYEPPYPEIPVMLQSDFENPSYKSQLGSNGFKISRGDKVLLDSDNVGGFIFADQFLQMSFKLSGKIYGLGEHQSSLQLSTNWTRFTLFNRDGIPQPETNLYGSQPFFMVMEPDGKCFGVFFHNSNAMDILLQPLPAITIRSIGGIYDFYIFFGPTPADVIKQYTEIVGRTFLPPYWSLGFHLSRLGYKNTSHIREVWQRTRDADIPFDTQWHDIDYMENRNDFTYDRENYKDLRKFVEEVHEAGMHYVPIIDPGISGCEPPGSYPPFDEGIGMDVFVKNSNGSVFFGKVWNPKCTAFPDFTAPTSVFYWARQIKSYHDQIPFDGIWIDMNEPSNFIDGSLDGCPPSKWDDPPYTPAVAGGKLSSLTLCMSARHAAGLHYDVHNLYGLTEAIATNKALKMLKKRPFIISRATYPGIGRYAGHWSGDVTSTWESMKATIPKMLSFSLFGVPMMGADICGFNGNTTALLCQRWSQLGAFYPFSRNHNSDDCIDQDPVALGEAVVKSTRKALLARYTLLPYLYTLFFKAHTEGETVARPLFFEFWDDPHTHNLDESFLLGCCILIVPVLEKYATTVKTYIPAGQWYDLYTGLGIYSDGKEVVVHAAFDSIPGFIRGGVVLPTQAPAQTTTLSRMNNIDLIAANNKSLGACGSLFWDDGESLDSYRSGKYGVVTFELTPYNLTSQVQHWGYDKPLSLGSIKILGFVKPIQALYFNNKEVAFKWDSVKLILTVSVKHPLSEPFVLDWTIAQLQQSTTLR